MDMLTERRIKAFVLDVFVLTCIVTLGSCFVYFVRGIFPSLADTAIITSIISFFYFIDVQTAGQTWMRIHYKHLKLSTRIVKSLCKVAIIPWVVMFFLRVTPKPRIGLCSPEK